MKGYEMNGPQCSAITKAGSRCPNRALLDRKWYFAHDPDLVDARKQGSYKGGKGKSKAARARKAIPEDLRDVGDLLLQAINEVKTGDLEPTKATAMAPLTWAYVTVYEAGLVESKLKDIEARLDQKVDATKGRAA